MKIIIYEDDDKLRHSLSLLIDGTPGYAVVGAFPNCSNVVKEVGELVPNFELPDQHGQLQSLESVRGPNGSLVLFHRSADW